MKNLSSLPDTELVYLLPNKKEAFDVLFLRYKNDLRNVVVHYIKDKCQAEDLVQEAFLKIYLSLKAGKYNDENKFLPWALRIAHNLCMDYLRKAKPKQITLPEGKEEFVYPSSYGDNAENKMIQAEQRRQLAVLTQKLSAEQKETVIYRYYGELSFKEIASLMNTSVNTSLGRVRYALQHLRSHVSNCPSLR